MIVLCTIARCIIFGVPRLPVRPCDERPPAMYGHFCLDPRVSVHDMYYCTCLNNTNLGSVTAVNGKHEFRGLLLELTEKILPPHRIWIPENFCYYPPPPPTESIRAKLGLPPPQSNGCWPVRLDDHCTVTSVLESLTGRNSLIPFPWSINKYSLKSFK